MTSADPHRPKRAKDQNFPPPPAQNPMAAYPVSVPMAVPLAAGPPVLPPQVLPPQASPPQILQGQYIDATPSVLPPQAASPVQHWQDASATQPRVTAKARSAPVVINPLGPKPAVLPVAVPAIAAQPLEEAPVDVTEAAVKSAPPFLTSMLVHMLLIIVLALITFSKAANDQVQLRAAYAESLGQQLLDDTLQSPATLEMQDESPKLSFDIKPADDPLAAPPKLSEFFLDANKATSNIDAPSIGLALTGREAGMKKALLPAYGGNATTESSVLLALEWLKRQQRSDGGWSLIGPYSDGSNSGENRCAATAMALLAFQGYGATHKPRATSPDFHDVVERGWNFLLKMQNKDGVFVHDGTHNQKMYAQAQATIALCEIYGMTQDARFKTPAQLALDFVHKAQSPELGGWRYEPRVDSDMSVTGWYVMALQSGLMAGLDVQSPNLELVNKFLDSVALEGGSRYAYLPDRKPGAEQLLTMTAEALLCRQYLGWKHDDPRMRSGIDFILANTINYSERQNVYYWYYATQACHHMDGDDWNRWNSVMRQAIPAAQTKTGPDRGSWNSVSDTWGSHGGRLYVTCLSAYMLETYYRHLPIYKWRLQQ